MQQPFFCSELSRRAGEKVFGTASTGGVWFLLEYAGAWGPHVLEQCSLASPVKDFLRGALETVPRSRVLFIKRGRAGGQTVSFFVVRCRERDPFVVRYELDGYARLTELDLARAAAGDAGPAGRLTREPLFLVCTHGRRDKCCAKFGVPVYRALRESACEQVWQSSHVGGDRFAANLVCFPHGLFYAHLTEETGRRAAEEYAAGRLVLDKYRGRACYSHHVQAAEFFTRAETNLSGLGELRFESSERLGEKNWRVRFASAAGLYEAEVSCRLSDFQNRITCQGAEPKPVPQFLLENFRRLEPLRR
ncbi:MAG TPA: sucrase ferredoxin [Pyrinomonadaceae bacterium]|nr:sucrase ferredoxin [Pyrinomonadaceae bacterium]